MRLQHLRDDKVLISFVWRKIRRRRQRGCEGGFPLFSSRATNVRARLRRPGTGFTWQHQQQQQQRRRVACQWPASQTAAAAAAAEAMRATGSLKTPRDVAEKRSAKAREREMHALDCRYTCTCSSNSSERVQNEPCSHCRTKRIVETSEDRHMKDADEMIFKMK